MGKAKRCILAICVAVLLVGAGTIIYRQAQGSESLWGTFAKDHKDLVKKYSDWFNKDGEFYFKIAEGKKDTAWWDKIFDKVANKEEGTKIPEELIKVIRFSEFSGSEHEIILASDGYPVLKPTLQQSERELEYIMREDPQCCRLYESTKGLKSGNKSFDDRTYIRFQIEA